MEKDEIVVGCSEVPHIYISICGYVFGFEHLQRERGQRDRQQHLQFSYPDSSSGVIGAGASSTSLPSALGLL